MSAEEVPWKSELQATDTLLDWWSATNVMSAEEVPWKSELQATDTLLDWWSAMNAMSAEEVPLKCLVILLDFRNKLYEILLSAFLSVYREKNIERSVNSNNN